MLEYYIATSNNVRSLGVLFLSIFSCLSHFLGFGYFTSFSKAPAEISLLSGTEHNYTCTAVRAPVCVYQYGAFLLQ